MIVFQVRKYWFEIVVLQVVCFCYFWGVYCISNVVCHSVIVYVGCLCFQVLRPSCEFVAVKFIIRLGPLSLLLLGYIICCCPPCLSHRAARVSLVDGCIQLAIVRALSLICMLLSGPGPGIAVRALRLAGAGFCCMSCKPCCSPDACDVTGAITALASASCWDSWQAGSKTAAAGFSSYVSFCRSSSSQCCGNYPPLHG